MALSKEQYDNAIQILKDTSMNQEGGMTYPDEVVAY